MIFGESGGGAKTSCLYTMPAAAPYFTKAAIESGPGVRMLTREMAAETTALVFQALGIAPHEWRKLLDVPAAELLRVQSQFPPVPPHQRRKTVGSTDSPVYGFGPVVDGGVLSAHPFDPTAPAISRNKPLITGWNEDEYTFFAWERGDTSAFTLDVDSLQSKLESQYGPDAQQIIATYRRTLPNATAPELFVTIASITMMGLGSIEIAEKKAAHHDAPVYLYQFGYKSEMTIPGTEYAVGTPHAMDITFKFNNETPHNSPGFLSGNNPDRLLHRTRWLSCGQASPSAAIVSRPMRPGGCARRSPARLPTRPA
jgi:para-nitrobenzyl esterase